MSFHLKTLFIAVTVTAILLGIFFALPLNISQFVCGAISVMAPAGFVAWIVYGRGYGRAFAIGCTSASAVLLFSLGLGTLLFVQTMQFGAASIGSPLVVIGEIPDAEAAINRWAILFTPYPLAFGLVVVSGGLSVLVRWLSLRQKCLLE
ncbi:MAG: hypothetical protein RIC55_36645 [Pirellulaceae bacterium]